jgi:hypothetical protein
MYKLSVSLQFWVFWKFCCGSHFHHSYVFLTLLKKAKQLEENERVGLSHKKYVFFTPLKTITLATRESKFMCCWVTRRSDWSSLKGYFSDMSKIFETSTCEVGRDRGVGIATRYGLDGLGTESRWGAKYSALVLTGPGAHSASCTGDTASLFRG